MPLNPTPEDLGLHSPALGPWFDNVDVQLPATGTDQLFVQLNLGGGVTSRSWLPPAAGTLSFFISTTTRSNGLAGLRNAAGEPAFADDRLIALFRLLPEVEARLGALSTNLPTLSGATATGAGRTRPRVRWFALELDQPSPNWAFLEGLLPSSVAFPVSVSGDAEKAKHLGLLGGGLLQNGSKPMTDLIRPEKAGSQFTELLNFPAGTAVPAKLWVFDNRGHPIDPGAVATWWNFLATDTVLDFTNIWEDSLDTATGDQRTCPLTPAGTDLLSLHLVNLHGGALTNDELARVDNTQNMTGTGVVRTRGTGANAAQLGFTAAPDPDDLPEPRMGLQPDGRLDASVSLWPSGPINNTAITRDFARVAIGSLEKHLIGQTRIAPTGASLSAAQEIEKRRAEDQVRVTTGLRVARADRGGLRASIDPAIQSILDVFAGGGATQLVTGSLERGFGARQASLPAGGAPGIDNIPTATAVALTGGGANNSGVAIDQRVLITLTFSDPGSVPSNCWVRAWTQDFDHERAEHIRREGGAGRVNASGGCSLVVNLPDGAVSPDALMGMELMVVSSEGHRHFSDVRFERPVPVGGSLSDFSSLSATTQVLICDTGTTVAQSAVANVLSGAVLVSDPAGTPALVDSATIPFTTFTANTMGQTLAAGDVVQLTEPAFTKMPHGELPASFGSAATLNRIERKTQSSWQGGFPLPGMLRLETVASNVDAAGGMAALATVPGLAVHHELLPHRLGHPECPAHQDSHGTGMFVNGAASVAFAEYTRDRTASNTITLATAADTPIPVPATPTADSLWVAGLRTEAAGVAAEVALDVLLDSGLGTGFKPYPFGDVWSTVETWLNDNIGSLVGSNVATLLGGTNDSINSILRAIDRRLLVHKYGAREGATSVIAAIERAEDFIYIETPALDSESFGAADDQLDIWASLLKRMDDQRALQVIICMPVVLSEASPAHLQRVRDALVAGAVSELSGGGNDRDKRFTIFHPAAGPQRALALTSTTVIVDDTYALTGSTHLWRRGLSFDSSFAVAVTDDRLQDGRAQEVLTFRRSLVAGRLGLNADQLPEDPGELVASIQHLISRGGHGRLAPQRIRPPAPDPDFVSLVGGSALTEADIWNRDGSAPAGFNPVSWVLELTSTVQSGEFNP